jgi:hypothetical protein
VISSVGIGEGCGKGCGTYKMKGPVPPVQLKAAGWHCWIEGCLLVRVTIEGNVIARQAGGGGGGGSSLIKGDW